jgi:hypothetical protein
VLPTLAVSLAIRPPTVLTAIGGSITGYELTFDGDALASPITISVIDYTTHEGFHCLKGIGEIDFSALRGYAFTVTAAAIGPNATSSASAPADVEMLVETSRPATIRQRIFDLLVAAQLTLHGKEVRIQGHHLGKPMLWPANGSVGDGRPFVEVGVCYTITEADDTDAVAMQQNELMFKACVISEKPDDAEKAIALAEKLRSKLVDLGLNAFGLADGGWTWRGSKPLSSPDGKVQFVEATFTLPPGLAPRGQALY